MNDEDAARFREKLDDAGYIARLKAGDEDASDELLEWLLKKLRPHIERKFCQTYADAQELASIAALHVYERLEKFKFAGKGSFQGWMYHVVRNKVLNELDKRKRAKAKGPAPLEKSEERIRDFINKHLIEYEAAILSRLESEEAEEEKALSPEEKEFLRRLHTLSVADRSILLLKEVSEFEDIARDELVKAGKPVTEKGLKAKRDAVHKRHQRAMKRALGLKEGSS